MQNRLRILLILCCPAAMHLAAGMVPAQEPPTELSVERQTSTTENLARALISERAAKAAQERKLRMAQRRQSGNSLLRPTVQPAATLLNNPAIYRIDYGMQVERAAVPFLMHADLQPKP